MIEAKIVADSISEAGDRITTFELNYPRFIHSELLTHRNFSRNSASSRAIPIQTMLDMIRTAPAAPSLWGINQSGMQADNVYSGHQKASAEYLWLQAAKSACDHAERLMAFGLHKQIVNRVLEPFVHMKTVVTSTEFDNFFYLRCHKDAQPEIRILAEKMYEAYSSNEPKLLQLGEWHTPYGTLSYWSEGFGYDYDMDLETALKVSAASCAAVSYRKSDISVEKACMIYDRLIESKPAHASPFEHQATPIDLSGKEENGLVWPDQEGITHSDNDFNLWSGNLKGWVQYRQLIDGHQCTKYVQD